MGYFLDRVKSLIKDGVLESKTGLGCEISEKSEISPPTSRAFSPDFVNFASQQSMITKPKPVEGSPQWHAETIAAAVRKEGVCVFWSDLFGEVVAFVKDDSFKGKVPAGLVTYNDHELRELFGEGKPGLSARDLRLIHEAKKAGGGRIISHEPKG